MPERRERPAPLLLVVDPSEAAAAAPFGSYTAVAATGQRLLAADLATRLAAQGAAVVRLLPERPPDGGAFHWGRWFAAAAGRALAEASSDAVDAIGYAGAGAMPLVDDAALETLLSPVAGEVVGNNRFSADAFVVAGDLDRALELLAACPTDNAAVRALEEGGFVARSLAATAWSRFDVDTPLDLALLRLATSREARRPGAAVSRFLAMAQLPGGRGLEVPNLDALGAVMRDRRAELVVAGRLPSTTLGFLETETACRTRALIEERGMRSAGPGGRPRSVLAALMGRSSPAELVDELARLGDAVVLDTRVLMAAMAGSADAAAWPPEEDRFASDFADHGRIATPWLAELAAAATAASVPVVLGGHALVSDGLRIIVNAAWAGRPAASPVPEPADRPLLD